MLVLVLVLPVLVLVVASPLSPHSPSSSSALACQERDNKHEDKDATPDGAVPAFLLDREGVSRAKVRLQNIF